MVSGQIVTSANCGSPGCRSFAFRPEFLDQFREWKRTRTGTSVNKPERGVNPFKINTYEDCPQVLILNHLHDL
jgi:hypothetical protein